ncbi:acetyl-CoA carboxylase, biotin carboxyl carrier protein [Sphingomonas melonis TY]|jgi:acetyl-CoA carboxylase biotin carboxyl carrier protein|uniref:Biotin carboxyl carrier protein of acetyl-CoA carboxylase n=1 Tax=Sphingomonas melonis TY TaxID=621456 RepID=A0A175Y2S5_9SPHN|nr:MULTISPECIES: acetyl-CoA carboxylase biotin carboxyl carrier protein [Sphingomonas]AOW23186.1 acetyl-CoA carboxylase, biotin carboxyl carrier protein [Sphingomonas melonis TY]ATI56617.1 acetyl-CoA carboxylase, biotin carboxyl carrier protein [Sphingomonas melonis]KZB94290.1 acetyl-CoA carboxylase, biotin carboxyl carrier protein [Sphingomonas melonis TY]MBI0530173.1 acetyl-CoA carboxylase biotin carboxyl carrier protein [Sphingomonas sp. TX0522]MBX8845508.1 acetyl-CoA carboxylase biotin car
MTDQTPNGAMQVDVNLVRQLAELLDATHLTEIEVEEGDRKIRVARKAAPQAAPVHYAPAPLAAAPAAPAAAAPVEAGAMAPAVSANAVKSPMVGTAYLAAEPGAKPFISVGQSVSAGDTLLIVEAMKVMNPIVAATAGTVRQILIENGQPVEFDQPLVVVE